MDNNTLSLIAKFTVRARKLIGSIDMKQFTESEDYREGIFSQIEDKADEELLVISLSLREAFSKPQKTSSPEDATADKKDAPAKYVFGPRG